MPNYTSGSYIGSDALVSSGGSDQIQTAFVSAATGGIDEMNETVVEIEVRLSSHLSKQVMERVSPNDSETIAKFVNESVVVYLQLAALRHMKGELLCRTPETGELRQIVLPYEKAAEDTLKNVESDRDQLLATSVNKVQK